MKEVYPLRCTGSETRECFEAGLGRVYKDGHVGTDVKIAAPDAWEDSSAPGYFIAWLE